MIIHPERAKKRPDQFLHNLSAPASIEESPCHDHSKLSNLTSVFFAGAQHGNGCINVGFTIYCPFF
jgi:hypothetical protein